MKPMGLVRPWKRVEPKPQGEVVVVATRLSLQRYRDIPRFLRWSGQVRQQVLKSEGAIGVTAMARPFRGEYCTITAWRDEPSLRAFVRSSPHREIMSRYTDVARGPGIFTSWGAGAETLPLKWADAMARLDAAAAAAAAADATAAV